MVGNAPNPALEEIVRTRETEAQSRDFREELVRLKDA